jgi:hypothetical protein
MDWRKFLDYEYVTTAELSEVVGGIHSLMHAGKFDEINALYATTKLDVDQSILVAIIRCPYVVKDHLPDWRAFVNKVLEEIPNFGDQGLREKP